MGMSFPTGFPEIDSLMAKLSTLVRQHGKDSEPVELFILKHRDLTWVDKRTGDTCYFEELANSMKILMEGFNITNDVSPKPPDPADYWKSGDQPFETDSSDAADWWKK
jgi:hypothetical protein